MNSTFNVDCVIDALSKDGYVVLDDAIPEALVQCQKAFHQIDQNSLKPAGVGPGRAQRIANVRSDKVYWLDNPAADISVYWQAMELLRQAVNRTFYLGLFDFECHFARYDVGDFYQKHWDAFRGKSNRRLSTIYYLNEQWQPSDGGELLIYQPQDSAQLCQRVQPRAGRLVVFFSEQFAHEVLPAKCVRRSLTGWFRVRENKL